MTMPKGRLWQPDSPQQEVLANGAVCGNALRAIAKMWARDDFTGTPDLQFFGTVRGHDPTAIVHYPIDHFAEDDDPVMSPFTEIMGLHRAEDLPILAWAIAPGAGSAAVVVDMLERPSHPGMESEPGEPVTYNDCQLIQGTPSEVLPRQILEKMGLR
jgi:hypothetical protein